MVASIVKFLAYMTTIFEGLHVGYSLEFQNPGLHLLHPTSVHLVVYHNYGFRGSGKHWGIV